MGHRTDSNPVFPRVGRMERTYFIGLPLRKEKELLAKLAHLCDVKLGILAGM